MNTPDLPEPKLSSEAIAALKFIAYQYLHYGRVDQAKALLGLLDEYAAADINSELLRVYADLASNHATEAMARLKGLTAVCQAQPEFHLLCALAHMRLDNSAAAMSALALARSTPEEKEI